jgi:calpain
MKIGNPWGNEVEWNGPWSDKSAEWLSIPDEKKEEIGLTVKDGTFWMSYDDFQKHFSRLGICNLNPDLLSEEELPRSHKRKLE